MSKIIFEINKNFLIDDCIFISLKYNSKIVTNIDINNKLILIITILGKNEKWMFPNTDIVNSFLSKSLKTDIPKQFNVLSEKVVDELNKRNISPSNFNINFDLILKEITKI